MQASNLKQNELSRQAKQQHLISLKVPKAERDKILSQLYGHTDSELHIAENPSRPIDPDVEKLADAIANEFASHAARAKGQAV